MNNQILNECLQGLGSTAYKAFGAHFSHEYNQDGVHFTVYAPHAAHVSLIGDFNDWQGYAMERNEQGIWSIFAANIPEFSRYKFRITTMSGETYDRIDPFEFYSEVRPNNASVVYCLDGFGWTDEKWMQTRKKNYNLPMNIYEMHAGSWKVKEIREPDNVFYTYTELAERLIPYIKQMGYTHIELLPLTEHPFDGSWGYQTTGYFAATSRYGSPKELMSFINECHQQDIGVIMDFVPLHFVTDFYALHMYDGGCVYESDYDHLRFSEWQTALFDFTKPYVLSFMKSALDFWISYYHIDGIRFDAVANLIYMHGKPEDGMNEPGVWFMKNVNYTLLHKFPEVMLIAEDSSNYLKVTAPVEYGGLGFDYKWDLGWMHDTLNYMATPPNERSGHHHKLTFSMSYFYNEKYILPFSHDEVVHGKRTIIDKIYGSYEEKFHQLRTLYVYMMTHPGKKLNFMGNELAEFKEWDESKELGWNLLTFPAHDAFHRFLQTLHALYLSEPPLYAQDYNNYNVFQWIDANNASQCVYSYKRKDLEGNTLYVVMNFSNRFYPSYQLRVEESDSYEELLCTDKADFGGTGVENKELTANTGYPPVLHVALAPFSSCIFKKK